MELLKLTPQTLPTRETPYIQGQEEGVEQEEMLEGDERDCQLLHLQLQE